MIPPNEFAALFDEYYPKLFSYIRSQLADRETAEDITAATFERAYKSKDTFDETKGSFATWLFRIGRNLVINHYAASERRPDVEDLDESLQLTAEEPTPEQRLLRREQQQRLREGLQQLSARDQEIVQLRFFGHLKNREIARLLELNERTVSVIILRALQKMKSRLEGEEAR